MSAQPLTRVTFKELTVVSSVVLLTALFAAVDAAFRGGLWIPHNDDWVYLHMAQWLHSGGTFVVESGSLTNAIGLVILIQPIALLFGDSVVVLQLTVAFLAAIAAVTTWSIIREILSRPWAIVSMASLLLSPIWLPLQFSFMTDVPAFAFQMFAIWAALKMRNSTGIAKAFWFVGALMLAFVAFSIREYALVAGIAILLWGIFVSIRESRRYIPGNIVIAAVWIVAVISLYKWRTTLPGAIVSSPAMSMSDLKAAILQTLQTVIFLGLCALPAALSFSPVKAWIRLSWIARWAFLALSVAFIASSFYAQNHGGLVLGNYFTEFGPYAGTVPFGTPPRIFSPDVMTVIMFTGMVGCLFVLLLAAVLIDGLMRDSSLHNLKFLLDSLAGASGLIALTVVGTLSGVFLVVGVTTAPMMDRYFLPVLALIPALACLVICRFELEYPRTFVAVGLGIVLLASVSLITFDTAMTVDGAKWKMGNLLVSQGFAAPTIDAGYEWYPYMQKIPAEGQYVQSQRNWWVTLYEKPVVCVGVGIGDDAAANSAEVSLPHFSVTNVTGTAFNFWAVPQYVNCGK